MTTTGQKIKIWAGNYKPVNITLLDANGALIPQATLAAGTIKWWTAKSAEGSPIIKKGTDEVSANNKIVITGDGKARFVLQKQDTVGVRKDTTFYAEAEFTDSEGNPTTALVGSLEVKASLIS